MVFLSGLGTPLVTTLQARPESETWNGSQARPESETRSGSQARVAYSGGLLPSQPCQERSQTKSVPGSSVGHTVYRLQNEIDRFGGNSRVTV